MEKNFVVESELKVEKPLTLEQIKDIIEKQDFNRFYRSSEIEEKYQKDQKDKEMLIPTKLKEIIELKHYEKSNNTERWIFHKNDYPYFLSEDLEHWILWDMKGNWEDTEKDWHGYKKNEFKDALISWINPPGLRSLDSIPHIHLVREKTA